MVVIFWEIIKLKNTDTKYIELEDMINRMSVANSETEKPIVMKVIDSESEKEELPRATNEIVDAGNTLTIKTVTVDNIRLKTIISIGPG